MRSELWRPERWPEDPLPSHAELVKEVQRNTTESLEQLQDYYSPENYRRMLY